MSMLSRYSTLAAGAPQDVTYVGGSSAAITGSTGTTTNVSLTSLAGGIASSPAENDVVIVYYGSASTSNRSLTVTTSGYTQLADLYSNDTFDANLTVAYKKMTSTPDTQVTVSATGATGDAGAVVVHVWRNVDTLFALDVPITTATGIDSALCNPPSITPATTGAVIISGGSAAHNTGIQTFSSSNLSNFVTQGGPNATNDVTVGVGSSAWTGGAFDPAAFTFSGVDSTSFSWAAVTLALLPKQTQAGPFAISQATRVNTSTSNTITINKPAGTQENDLMVAVVFTQASQTFTAPAGWTEVLDSGAAPGTTFAYKVAGASEGASYSFVSSSASFVMTGGITTYRNAAYSAIGSLTSNADPLVLAAVTNSVSYSRIFAFAAHSAAISTISGPASMQKLWSDSDADATSSLVMQDASLSSAGSSGTRTFNMGISSQVSGALVAIKPAASYTKYANYIASNSGSAVTATSVSVNTPAYVPDNLLLFAVSASSGAGDNISFTTPSGWTLLSGNTTDSTAYQPGTYIFYRTADGTEAASYSATASIACNLVGAIVTLAGVDAATLTAGTTNTGSGTTAVAANAVTATANGIVLFFGAQANNNQGPVTFTPPSGMTEAVDVSANGASDLSMEVAYQEGVSAGSTGTETATASSAAGTNRFRAILVTVGAK